jgi:hypothetical protein
MPSVALIRCQSCEATWERLIRRMPLPFVLECRCGGQLQIVGIRFEAASTPALGAQLRGTANHQHHGAGADPQS